MCLSTINRSTTSVGVESRPRVRLLGRRFSWNLVDDVHQLRIFEQAVGVAHPVFHQLSTGKARRACANNSASCGDWR